MDRRKTPERMAEQMISSRLDSHAIQRMLLGEDWIL
jgi:hypothetical protein